MRPAAFMMTPHYSMGHGTFTIEEDNAAAGKDKNWWLPMKGTKVGFCKYYGSDNTGVLSIGLY